MIFEDLHDQYAMADGAIVGVEIFSPTSTSNGVLRLTLRVRRREAGKTDEPIVRMTFRGNLKVDINDYGGYLGSDYDDITLSSEGGRYYVSVDPYGNSGVPDDRDNYVFVADEVEVEELGPPNKAMQPDVASPRR